MAAAKGRKLVVDANIARSAGNISDAPISTHCREVLLAIFRRGHFIVMTDSTYDEWDKHQSRFSHSWRASMQQKGRIVWVSDTEFKKLKALINGLPPRVVNQRALIKDFHIFASALCTDRIIISNDLALLGHLQKLCSFHEPVGKLLWADTLQEEHLCARWIERGARNEQFRYIGRSLTQ